MNWRPENWDEIVEAILPLRFRSLDPDPFKFIEAGADAMLEALREQTMFLSYCQWRASSQSDEE